MNSYNTTQIHERQDTENNSYDSKLKYMLLQNSDTFR